MTQNQSQEDESKDLLNRLMKAKNLSEVGMSQRDLIINFQNKIKELLHFKETATALRTQLESANESRKKLKEEFDLYKSETESKLYSFSSGTNQSCQQADFIFSDSDHSFGNNSYKFDQRKFASLIQDQKTLQSKNKQLKKAVLVLQNENQTYSEQINQLQEKITHLQNKVERRNKIITTLKGESQENNQNEEIKEEIYQKKLAQLADSQNALNHQKMFSEQEKLRAQFCRIIEEKFEEMNILISNLHYTLTGEKEKEQLRPIILSVIFSLRWKKIFQKHSAKFDPSSLVSYSSMKYISNQTKLLAIQDLFKSLTNELIITKESLQKSLISSHKSKRQFYDIENVLNINQNDFKMVQDQACLYKTMISNMNEEMATLISVPRFEKVQHQCSELELENENLKGNILKMKIKLDEKDKNILDLQRKYHEVELQLEINQQKTKIDKQKISKQNNDIDLLTVNLKNRSKDLLSYERMCQAVRPNIFRTNSLTNTENDEDMKPDFERSQINPKFIIGNNSLLNTETK